jgi:hypothetical protein
MGISFLGIGGLGILPGAILGIIAVVMAIRHWKKYPTASMLVLLWGLFSLLTVLGTLVSFGYFWLGSGGGSLPAGFEEIFFIAIGLASLLLSFTPALLLFAVYAGRGGQAEQVSRQF